MPSEKYIKENYIDKDGLRGVLRRIDPEFLIDLTDEVNEWFDQVKGATKCKIVDDLSAELFDKPCLKKSVLAGFLGDVCSILFKQHEMVRDLRAANELLKTEMIESQSSVIKVQKEHMECKTAQFQSLQTTVQTTIQDSVQAELKSYSSVVAEKSQSPAISSKALKQVVQTVVEEEDRNKNLMVFGIPEDDTQENLADKVLEVFQALGEKPRIEVSRVGNKMAGKVRPIKVSLRCGLIVHQILAKARKLRAVEKHKFVFVCPDRSPDQRAEHRQLVRDLKEKRSEDSNKRHFIKSGQICSVDKAEKPGL